MENASIIYALLAMQRALLGEVTPELRAVFIDLDKDKDLFLAHFYYNAKASEERIDLWNCAITEACAALAPFLEQSSIKRLDYPAPVPIKGYCAYLRKKRAFFEMSSFLIPSPTSLIITLLTT